MSYSSDSVSQSGNCDPSTPFFNVNLTGFPDGTWNSTAVPRVGNCCGTLPPDKCVEFKVTLDPAAVAINFQIISGAVPSGALFYQVGCGPPIAVGSQICLNGPGPYTLTFCKPGNNINTYAITSISGPSVSPDDTIGNGCSAIMYASGLLVNSSINWTSVYPGVIGSYNSYLTCTNACDSTIVTGTSSAPSYVDYEICGIPKAGVCVSPGLFCDTVRIHFSPPITNSVNPNPAVFCSNESGILLAGIVGGGVPPYTYAWTNGANGTGTIVGTGLTYNASASGTYSFIVYDHNYPSCPEEITSVSVATSPVPVVNAGPDQTICGSSFTLNGTVTGATGGIWTGGNGSFSPSATAGNATYTPTPSELITGILVLTFTSTGNGSCSPVSDQVVVHISPLINVTISGPVLICNGSTATLTANVTGGIAPFSYSWSTGQTSQTLTNVAPGTYSVVTTASGGSNCTATATISIVANPQIIITTSPNNSISCSTTALISASASGGTGTLNYLWSNGAATPSAIVYTGTYTITVTDAVGCSANNSLSVIASNSSLTESLNQPPVLCNGASTTLTAIANGGFGNYSYSWNTGANSNSIVVGAGNYCATVTDGGGCITSACVSVTQNTALVVNIPVPAVICNGSSGTATAFANGGQAPYNYSWSNGQVTQTILVLPGNYTVTVTDAIGCTTSATVTISQAPPLNISMTSAPGGCFGGNGGSATATVAGGSPGYYYSWLPYGGSSSTASNLMAGTFTVTVTDALGCSKSSPVILQQPSPLNASVLVNNNVSCYNGNDGSATVYCTGGTPVYSYSWSSGAGNVQNSINLIAGNYNVIVTDLNGCTQNVSATITQPTQLTGSIASTTNVSCNGGNNGGIAVSVSGGSPGYTYSWAPFGGSNANTANLSAGTYTVTITDLKGCIIQVNSPVTEPTVLSSGITGSTNISCNGGSNGTAIVSASGGIAPYTYIWNTSPIQTGTTATNLSAGNYFVTVNDSKGCSTVSTTITLSQTPVLAVTASPSSLISCDSTITISASASGGSGAYNYQWSNGATTTSIVVNTGTYTIFVTDGYGCTANNSVSVMASNSTLTLSIPTPASICFGSSTTLSATPSGGFGSYTYQWNTAATSSSIVAGSGIYCVTVTDGGGCIANACVNVSQNTPISANIGIPPVVCQGALATITAMGSGGQPPYSYFWNTGQTTASITKPAGTYTVIVTDATGSSCLDSAVVSIDQEPSINLDIITTNVSCFGGNNGTAMVYANGGLPGYSYSWTPAGGINAFASNLFPGSYMVTVTDQIGCFQNASVTITQPSSIVSLNTSSTPVTCFGQSNGTVTASGNGGNPPYSYYWWINGSSAPTITGVPQGANTITVADSTGCYANASAIVSGPNDISLTSSITATTCGSDNGIATIIASGGTGAFSYSWSSGDSSASATNLAAGNYTITVADANGCQKQLTLTVPATPALLSTSFVSTTMCLNSITSFTDMSNTSNDPIINWSWNFGEPASGFNNFSTLQNPVHTYNSSGIFSATLIVTTAIGCTGTYSTNVLVYPRPMASYTAMPTCENTPVLFTNTSSISTGFITAWNWNFGDPASGLNNTSNQQSPTHIFSSQGTYLITQTVTSDKGCTHTIAQNLSVWDKPNAGFSATSTCQNLSTSFTNTSSVSGGTINSWTWNFGDTSAYNTNQHPNHIYGSNGTYNVILTVTTTNGCQDSDTVPVIVYPLPIASFSAPPVCMNNATIFTNLSTISSGTLTTWAWDFGNFTPVYYGANPNYMYSNSGIFNVSLVVISNNNCKDTLTKPVNVDALPIANFSSNDVCLNTPSQFSDNSTVQGGSITSWLWGFGDGSPVGTIQSPSHVYFSPGPYNASLVATSNNGCKDTITKPLTIFPLPIVQFIIDDSSGCATYCTQFNDASSMQNGIITNWVWDFGDQTFQSTKQNPEHCYPQSGLYTITLTTTTSNNCSATKSIVDLINVYPVPDAEFILTPNPASTINSIVSFTDLSLGASSWVWNFGDIHDTLTSYLENPTHDYLEAGYYCVTEIVQNSYHCVDTAIHCIDIDPEFTFFIPNAFTPGISKGSNDGFGGAGTNISQFDMWIFDRWGNMIFHTTDLERKWDGRANNGKDIAQQDVYIYLVELLDFKGNMHKYRGTVTLVR